MADFTDLLDQLCVLGDIEPALLESDGAGNRLAQLCVDDVVFYIAESDGAPGGFSVECTLTRKSGDVVHAFAASLADTDAPGLLEALRTIAVEASTARPTLRAC